MNAIVEQAEPISSVKQETFLRRLRQQYPFVYARTLTTTAHGRKVPALQIGQGDTKVLLTAGHHANEWITSLLCWRLVEEYCAALQCGGYFGGERAMDLYQNSMLYIVPMVNPDGIDLVTGAISKGSEEYRGAEQIAAQYPEVPFPQGWKANLQGVDLNLNYPAGWELARTIKAELGVHGPAPRDFVGTRSLDQLETAALAAYTCCIRPDLLLAYHTQGREIYYQYDGIELPQAKLLAEEFAELTGYQVATVPPESANAGFKDWFIQRFCRPGFTIEAGLGENPLPVSQLEQLYQENAPLLAFALIQ